MDCTVYSPSETWAAGAIISTPLEVARFLDALLGGQLLSDRSLAAMRDSRPIEDPAGGWRPGRGYGYGLDQVDLPGIQVAGGGGDHFGASRRGAGIPFR